MSQEKFDDFLENPLSKIRTTSNVLMKAFWLVMYHERFTVQRWGKCMHKWVNDPASGIRQVPSTKTEARSNLRQQLVSEKLSWRIFNRAIKAIGITKAEMVFRYTFDKDGDENSMKEISLPILKFRGASQNGGEIQNPESIETDDGSDRS